MRWAVTLGAVGGGLLMAQSASAQTISGSLRPELRPSGGEVTRAASIPILTVPGLSVARPKLRPTAVAEQAPPQVAPSVKDAGFQDWRVGMRARAQSQGIRGDVFDTAFRGVHYDPDVIKRDRNQSEFSKTIWE